MPLDNIKNELISTSLFNKKQDGIRSPGFKLLYENMKAERKAPNRLVNDDNAIDKALEQIEKSIDFQTKLMLAAAKNSGLPGEESSNKSKEMSDSAIAIGQAMAMKASINAQIQSIKAQENPAVNLMDLKGKVIDYNDSNKMFSGNPVKYHYKVSHNDSSNSAKVNLVFTLKDKDGKVVKTVRQTGDVGEHEFIWDGTTDKRGAGKVEHGEYTLEVKAIGNKNVAGQQVTFPVTASVVLSGVVESIKLEKGTAKGVMVDGKLITRDQIIDIRDNKTDVKSNYLTPELIGNKVELDLSRAQVKDGLLTVHYNNHVENPGYIKVNIYNENNKFIKTVKSSDKLEDGFGQVVFREKNLSLDDGKYNIKVFVQDKTDPEKPREVELKYKAEALVAGINANKGTFMSTSNEHFDVYNIESVIGNYLTPEQEKAQKYIGAEVAYENDTFKYENGAAATDFNFIVNPDEPGGALAYGMIRIYDTSNDNSLLATFRGKYNPSLMLDDQSKLALRNHLRPNYYTQDYENLSGAEAIEVNHYIESEIATGGLVLKDEYKDDFGANKRLVTFPAWDGKATDGTAVAKVGNTYQRDFTPIYSRADGTEFFGDTDREVMVATVEHVDIQGKKLSLNLRDGPTIDEERVIKILRKNQ